MDNTAQLYDDIVQRLVTAKWARELGHAELADLCIDEALQTAQRLVSDAANAILHLTVAA